MEFETTNVTCDTSPSWVERIDPPVSFVYGSITIALYVVHIVLVIKKPILHHPFFYQYILLSISSIILWLTTFLVQRIIPNPLFCNLVVPLYKEKGLILLQPLLFCYYGTLSIQIITVISISINRMTAVLYPISAPKIWARNSRRTIFLIVLIACIYSFYLYGWRTFVDYNPRSKRLALSYVPAWPRIPFALMSGILSLICLIVVFVTTLITLSRLYKLPTSKRTDLNLYWTSLGFTVSNLVVMLYSIHLFYTYEILNDVFGALEIMTYRKWIYDVNCLLPAWLLLATNKQIRRFIFRKPLPIQRAVVSPMNK